MAEQAIAGWQFFLSCSVGKSFGIGLIYRCKVPAVRATFDLQDV